MEQEISEEELERLEQELERLEQTQESNYEYPTPEKKDSTLKLFRELIKSGDSRKFAYLTNTDLGTPRMPVRDLLEIGVYLEKEGLTGISDYLKLKAENTLATSMSNKGWFGNLIVTQIKKETKIRGEPTQIKKGLFSKTPKEELQ